MKRITWTWLIALFLALTVFAPTTLAQSFDPVFEWINRFRQSEEVELQLRVRPDSFTVSRKEATAIDKATFDQLLKSAGQSRSLPQLKLTPAARMSVHYLGDNLELEEHLSRSAPATQEGAKSWMKKEIVPIATYPLSQWNKFLGESLKHGLVQYIGGEFNQRPYHALYFKQTGQNRLQLGADSLTLSDEFYQFMRLAKEYQPVSGTEGFVILIHEPHSSVSGQLQLVPGLKALLSSNQPKKFSFLVEGEYEPPSRSIEFNTLDKAVDNAASQTPGKKALEPLVYNLLSRHLIDGPLAYRLIHDRELPAIAIDDLKYLESKPHGARPRSPLRTDQAIIKIFQAARGVQLPDNEARQIAQLGLDALQFIRTDIRDIHGSLLVDYYKGLADSLTNLATRVEALRRTQPSLQTAAEIEFLKTESAAYRAQLKIYEDALVRDVTMTDQIVANVKSSRQRMSQRIPLAFIGNFHTDGITRRLREQNIGYVVIEPRNLSTSEQERKEFDCLLYQTSRESCLKSLLSARKMRVVPTVSEVKTYYVPYLNRVSSGIARRQRTAAESFNKITPAKRQFEYESLSEALNANGALAGAQVEFGVSGVSSGGGGEIPPTFRTAFAFFEPGGRGPGSGESAGFGSGDGGKIPRFFIIDPSDLRWQDRARYNCIREKKFIEPIEVEGFTVQRQVIFYQDRGEGQRLFASLYDPTSRRFYLFEGDKVMAVLAQLELPKLKDDQEIRIHMLLTELERLNRQRRKGNG